MPYSSINLKINIDNSGIEVMKKKNKKKKLI